MGPRQSRAEFAKAVAALSERQRVGLRMVARGHESKTIAPQFGKSRHTIDKDLEHAKSMLGARNRFEAARWLVDFEDAGYEPFVYETQDLPLAFETSNFKPSEELGGAPQGSSVGEERAQFAFDLAAPSTNEAPTQGVDRQIRNRLRPWQLFAIAIAGAVAVVVVLAGMLAVTKELQPLLTRILTG